MSTIVFNPATGSGLGPSFGTRIAGDGTVDDDTKVTSKFFRHFMGPKKARGKGKARNNGGAELEATVGIVMFVRGVDVDGNGNGNGNENEDDGNSDDDSSDDASQSDGGEENIAKKVPYAFALQILKSARATKKTFLTLLYENVDAEAEQFVGAQGAVGVFRLVGSEMTRDHPLENERAKIQGYLKRHNESLEEVGRKYGKIPDKLALKVFGETSYKALKSAAGGEFATESDVLQKLWKHFKDDEAGDLEAGRFMVAGLPIEKHRVVLMQYTPVLESFKPFGGSPLNLAKLMRAVLHGLRSLSEIGMHYTDMKTSNIGVEASATNPHVAEHVRLIDFGSILVPEYQDWGVTTYHMFNESFVTGDKAEQYACWGAFLMFLDLVTPEEVYASYIDPQDDFTGADLPEGREGVVGVNKRSLVSEVLTYYTMDAVSAHWTSQEKKFAKENPGAVHMNGEGATVFFRHFAGLFRLIVPRITTDPRIHPVFRQLMAELGFPALGSHQGVQQGVSRRSGKAGPSHGDMIRKWQDGLTYASLVSVFEKAVRDLEGAAAGGDRTSTDPLSEQFNARAKSPELREFYRQIRAAEIAEDYVAAALAAAEEAEIQYANAKAIADANAATGGQPGAVDTNADDEARVLGERMNVAKRFAQNAMRLSAPVIQRGKAAQANATPMQRLSDFRANSKKDVRALSVGRMREKWVLLCANNRTAAYIIAKMLALDGEAFSRDAAGAAHGYAAVSWFAHALMNSKDLTGDGEDLSETLQNTPLGLSLMTMVNAIWDPEVTSEYVCTKQEFPESSTFLNSMRTIFCGLPVATDVGNRAVFGYIIDVKVEEGAVRFKRDPREAVNVTAENTTTHRYPSDAEWSDAASFEHFIETEWWNYDDGSVSLLPMGHVWNQNKTFASPQKDAGYLAELFRQKSPVACTILLEDGTVVIINAIDAFMAAMDISRYFDGEGAARETIGLRLPNLPNERDAFGKYLTFRLNFFKGVLNRIPFVEKEEMPRSLSRLTYSSDRPNKMFMKGTRITASIANRIPESMINSWTTVCGMFKHYDKYVKGHDSVAAAMDAYRATYETNVLPNIGAIETLAKGKFLVLPAVLPLRTCRAMSAIVGSAADTTVLQAMQWFIAPATPGQQRGPEFVPPLNLLSLNIAKKVAKKSFGAQLGVITESAGLEAAISHMIQAETAERPDSPRSGPAIAPRDRSPSGVQASGNRSYNDDPASGNRISNGQVARSRSSNGVQAPGNRSYDTGPASGNRISNGGLVARSRSPNGVQASGSRSPSGRQADRAPSRPVSGDGARGAGSPRSWTTPVGQLQQNSLAAALARKLSDAPAPMRQNENTFRRMLADAAESDDDDY